jgi:hypothetical protein
MAIIINTLVSLCKSFVQILRVQITAKYIVSELCRFFSRIAAGLLEYRGNHLLSRTTSNMNFNKMDEILKKLDARYIFLTIPSKEYVDI